MSRKPDAPSEKEIKIRPRQPAAERDASSPGESSAADSAKFAPRSSGKENNRPPDENQEEMRWGASPEEAEASEPPGEGEAEGEVRGRRRRRRRKKERSQSKFDWSAYFKELPLRRVSLGWTVFYALVVVVIVGAICVQLGVRNGLKQAYENTTRENVPIPPEKMAELEAAFEELRQGETPSALTRLQKLDEKNSGYSSVTYLVAFAAMQNGDIPLAEEKVNESIAKNENVAAAMVLKSVLETQQAVDPVELKMGDHMVRSEVLLRKAAIVDVVSPAPHLELASLLRYKGRREEAVKELKAAQVRLNPNDSQVVVDVTLSLMTLEDAPADRLPVVNGASDDVKKLFPAAYVAMRQGDFAQAATILKKCQALLPANFFTYLVNDPALRKFSDKTELKSFFGG